MSVTCETKVMMAEIKLNQSMSGSSSNGPMVFRMVGFKGI